jgi:hypothetical protein
MILLCHPIHSYSDVSILLFLNNAHICLLTHSIVQENMGFLIFLIHEAFTVILKELRVC